MKNLLIICALVLAGCSGSPPPTTHAELAQSYSDQANLAFSQGKFNDALKLYLKALERHQLIDDQGSLLRVYNNISVILYELGRFQEAESFAWLALEKAQKDEKLKAKVLINLGSILSMNPEKKDQTQDAFESALQILKEKSRDQARAKLGLALLKCKGSDLNEAETLLKEADEFFLASGDKAAIASCLFGYALISIQRNDFEKARSFLIKALNIDKELQSPRAILRDLVELAEISKPAQALDCLSRALLIAKSVGTKKEIEQIEQKIASLKEK